MGGLSGRTALVTGGSRGLGAAIARALADEGAHVGVLSRSADDVRAVAAEIGGTALVADVTDADRLTSVLQRFGNVDIVVANAGVIWPLGRFADVDLAEWEQAVAINLLGAARVVHPYVTGMVARGWGRIVTISSGAAALPGMPGGSAYSTTKAALDMFTVNLARELAGTGVTANALRPGAVDTDMQAYMRNHRPGGGSPNLIPPQASAAFVVGLVLGDETGLTRHISDPR